jgi:hypothetical protein
MQITLMKIYNNICMILNHLFLILLVYDVIIKVYTLSYVTIYNKDME